MGIGFGAEMASWDGLRGNGVYRREMRCLSDCGGVRQGSGTHGLVSCWTRFGFDVCMTPWSFFWEIYIWLFCGVGESLRTITDSII